MDAAALIRTAITASLMLVVFSLGLRSSAGDARYLFERPGLLARSVLAMNVVMPLLVLWLVTTFDLRPAVKIALFALSISPVPPFLPGKQLKLAHSGGYTYGLLVATAILAIVLVPLTMAWVGDRAAAGARVRVVDILSIVTLSILLPLGIGMAVRRYAPTFAARIEPWTSKFGILLLVIGCVPIVIVQWASIRALIGDGTLLAIVAFTALGLAVGHLLGGPEPDHRSVLALATAARHPSVALAIAAASFPQQTLVPAAVLLALLVGVLASAPYVAWRKKMGAAGGVGGPSNSPLPR
jgi:BASS family bile acid:Na+ symporter